MIETMFSSLFAMLSSPHMMGLMLLAVAIGLVVGVTPGIGGRLSIALAIPFVFGMETIPGAVFLLTMHAVNGTSGQISSIMFGVPGDGDDAATTIDGYPMAKNGEAGRALGASVTASGFGGIVGAIVFAVMIPVLEPVVLAFSPAEFFLLALLGITFIAFLAGRDRIFKGLIVGLFGMMLATVGMDPNTGTPRFAGNMLFLWDGNKIVAKVRKRAPWIQRQLRYFAQFMPRTPDRSYVSGETHLYLGRQYKLKVVQHVQQQVKLQRGQLVVQSCRPRQADLTQALVETWYRDRAHTAFRRRLTICQERFSKPEAFAPHGLIVRQMDQRWGSMTPSGNLVLNRALIQASVDAIDYVITHELCHLRYPHHGPDFFRLLRRVMPDWERRKLKLERQMA